MSNQTGAFVQTNGIRMHYVAQGVGPAVVFCHGFPEVWYSWRHQLPALAAAGFRAIAPDLRGYGDTDKPERIEDYDIHHLAGDMVGLLDGLEIERAVVVGHDWGGAIVWDMALMYPERVRAVIALNTPFSARGPVRPTEGYQSVPDGRFNYVIYFQEPGRAERDIEPNLESWFETSMRRIAVQQRFLTPDDLNVFVEAFRKGGLTGPLNYYRNIDRNWETTRHLAGRKVACPALMVCAENDPILLPSMTDGMERFVPDLTRRLVKDCGHWTQQEKPDEVNTLMIDFLRTLPA